MSKAELPVFSDNLRSSASWQDLLARAQEPWRVSLTAADSGAALEADLRDRQLAGLLHLGARAGESLDEPRVRAAANLVSGWAREEGARLDTGRLLELQGTLLGAAGTEDLLRKTEPLPIHALHDPTPVILLPRMLDHAFDWFTTPGFNELHPVEQAAVVYLRLLDLHPFPARNEPSAILAAGFYTERAALPPLIVSPEAETLARYATVFEAAFRMLTQPLVEFFAELLVRAMRGGLSAER
ncbi:MAG TPA: hypothetical protein VJ302_08230 [Blastocatellia bacterium]|nr:hypothetical protein [Blastocatellia bacterium]